MRPNIRVEIQNNLVEAMEVDENEEGEISDNEETDLTDKHNQAKPKEAAVVLKSSFASAVLTKKDEEKLLERAKRFALNPQEIKNFKDEDLQLLHSSLGITPTNESNIRFEVIHMRGINQMNFEDILEYFMEYAPVSVEWIDEECCNVVWSDRISSSRALHFLSKPVRGMPVRDDSSYFDNLQESEEIDTSILLINKNREIELKEDTDDNPLNKLLNSQNSVDISEITATIPPGYWRLGNPHPKNKSLLLRFGLKTDKKPVRIEQFGKYYKTKGKMKGTRAPTQGIFGRNKDLHKTNENPWTVLAKSWDEDAQFRERERTLETSEPKLEIKNQSLRNRLGLKRKEESEEETEPAPKKKVKIPRMRMYADEEEEKIKRKQMLQKINTHIKKIDQDVSANSDLRTILNMTSRTHGVKLEKTEPEVFDLGSRLKNRNKKMVFQIKTEAEENHRRNSLENLRRDSLENPRRDFLENPMRNSLQSKSRRERDIRSRRRVSSDEEDQYEKDDVYDKPKSKVAVVIKTQKKPTVASAVASTIWSRVNRSNNSESESDSESASIDSISGVEEVEEFIETKTVTGRRPGFTSRSKENSAAQFKSPLKIEINNDHFRRS